MSRVASEAVPEALRSLLETGSMAGMTDGELVERFATSRDSEAEAAFAALVSRHGPMVLGVCRHRLGDPHTADDAFQAVFLVLARRAGSIRRPDLLGPWLHAVATRVARKARAQVNRRRRREITEVEMTRIESVGGQADARSFRDEDAVAVHEEIGRLPERYRRAVVLCHFEGLTHVEAARRLGCAPGTVGSLVSRARALLRGRLARRGFSAGALVLAGSLDPKMATAAVSVSLERATIQAALTFATRRAAVAGVGSKPAAELAGAALKAMTLNKVAIAATLTAALGVAVGVGGLAAGMSGAAEKRVARRQVQKARNEPAGVPPPSLPDAVTQPPPWLGRTAPFDVASFFAAPPPEENAAPRYLEALFEFGAQMEVCFPESPDRESRKRAAEQRLARFAPIDQATRKDPRSVPAAEIDAVVAEYDTGFRKLDWAQQRPGCVFQTGLNVASQIPHAMVAGQVGRVARLKVRRELERGEFEGALRDVSRLLRFSRDLRPRGVMIVDMVSASIDRAVVDDMIVPMLAAQGLTAGYCDRILALLLEHESRSIDAYAEGLRAEYLGGRATLHDMVYEQQTLRRQCESIGSPAGPSIVASLAEPVLISALRPGAPMPRPGVGQQLQALADRMMSLRNIPDLDARIARSTPDELARQVDMLNEVYRGLLAAAHATDLERIRKSNERPRSLVGVDILTRVTRGLLPAFTAFTQRLASTKARIRIAQGLVAVRRWQLGHDGGLPPSLEAAAKEAGLPTVPVDPYDGRPIRFAVVDGRPTVYAIGQDGRDDGGRLDNARSPDSGDVLLRLPKP